MSGDAEKALTVYRHAIAALCKQNGGTLVVQPPESTIGETFSIWYRLREDNALEFTLEEGGGTAH
jgi:hypothetical protein